MIIISNDIIREPFLSLRVSCHQIFRFRFITQWIQTLGICLFGCSMTEWKLQRQLRAGCTYLWSCSTHYKHPIHSNVLPLYFVKLDHQSKLLQLQSRMGVTSRLPKSGLCMRLTSSRWFPNHMALGKMEM